MEVMQQPLPNFSSLWQLQPPLSRRVALAHRGDPWLSGGCLQLSPLDGTSRQLGSSHNLHFQQLSSAVLEALLNIHGSFVFKDAFSWSVLHVLLSLQLCSKFTHAYLVEKYTDQLGSDSEHET